MKRLKKEFATQQKVWWDAQINALKIWIETSYQQPSETISLMNKLGIAPFAIARVNFDYQIVMVEDSEEE